MDYTKIWDVVRFMFSKDAWAEKLRKNDREFWKLLPPTCRELKIKLSREEESEAYHRVCNKLREES